MRLLIERLTAWRRVWIVLLLLQAPLTSQAATAHSASYTNYTRKGPVSIHLIRIPRKSVAIEIQSLHSGGKPIGLSPVSEQLKGVQAGTPIGAINGDFYQREGLFAGDPRGLQIVNGELISAPMGSSSFWIDAVGQPHITTIQSALRITWPGGSTAPLGLNGKCDANELELYTSALGSAPRGNSGREIVLFPVGGDTNAPFRAGRDYSMRVHEVREAANAPIAPGTFLLTLGPSAAKSAPAIQPGAMVKISSATIPSLRGVKSAISGGPTLVISRKRQRFDSADSDSYQYSSMLEKHPRSALGWNEQEYFWIQVDGRRKDSVGMTLNELAAFMIELGCEEAMNLDGGGSATIWFDGKVRNQPCDGYERPVANSLAVVRKSATTAK